MAVTEKFGQLFNTSPDNIGLHLKNIFAEGELAELATAEDFSVVQHEGSREVQRMVRPYNLDAIIAVGYRVNSKELFNNKMELCRSFRRITPFAAKASVSRVTAAAILRPPFHRRRQYLQSESVENCPGR